MRVILEGQELYLILISPLFCPLSCISFMERFPIEIMVQIANCLSKSDLSRFGTCSSKCAAIAEHILYHTMTLLDINDSSKRCARFIRLVTSRPHLPSMIRVLSVVGHRKWPELSLAKLLRYCDHIEELLLQGISVTGTYGNYHSSHPAIFSSTHIGRLRRFHCRDHTATPDLIKWVTRIPTITDVRLPEPIFFNIAHVFEDPVLPPTWLKNLERYLGPLELLGGLTSGCKLLHFSTCLEMPDLQLQLRQLATVCGYQLQTLHYLYGNFTYAWETSQSQKLPPALLPQLFPNLLSVAWVLVNPLDRDEVRTFWRPSQPPLIAM